jgi:hypothetical protein
VGVSASDAQAPGLFAGCRVLYLYGLIAAECFCMHVIELVCLYRLWCNFKGPFWTGTCLFLLSKDVLAL